MSPGLSTEGKESSHREEFQSESLLFIYTFDTDTKLHKTAKDVKGSEG